MKKTLLILTIITILLLTQVNAELLHIDAKFQNTQTNTTTIEYGESENYTITIVIETTSQQLVVDADLFRLTDNGYTYVKQLFQETHTGPNNPLYQKTKTITLNDYAEPGTYMIDITGTETTEWGNNNTESIGLTLTVNPEPTNEPPIADFEYTPEEVCAGDLVTFTSTSYSPTGLNIIDYQWIINGQTIGTTETINYQVTQPITHYVYLSVTDEQGQQGHITKQIEVQDCTPPNQPPIANFEYTPQNPLINEEVTFTSTSTDPDGYITEEKWYIDNQDVFQGINNTIFTYIFTTPGTYEIKLEVTDNEGATNTITKTITIQEQPNQPPIANFEYEPLNPYINRNVTFTSTSTDPDGYITEEKWYINNQEVYEGTNQTSFNHTFTQTGTYEIKLKVTDNEGTTNQITKEVTVRQGYNINEPPIANFKYEPQNPIINEEVTFTSTSTDPDGYITEEKWYINGQLKPVIGQNQTIMRHTFTQTGIHDVMLIVTDNQGATNTIMKTIRIRDNITINIRPIANFTQNPDPTQINERVTFTSTSTDPDGHIVKEEWYINNEPKPTFGINQTTLRHTFRESGNYEIKLIVTDNQGAKSTKTKTITITDPEELIPPIAQIQLTPTNPQLNEITTLTSLSYDPNGYITQETWYINDEQIHEGQNQTSFQHTFTELGTHIIKLEVTDNQNLQSTARIKIFLQNETNPNQPPIASFEYEPQNPTINEEVTFTSTSTDPDGHIIREEWYINNQQVHEGTNQTSFTTRFTQTGTYQITLVVKDNMGVSAHTTQTITITDDTTPPPTNQPPIADFIYTPINPIINQPVTFRSTSRDPDGHIIREEWYINGRVIHQGTNQTSFQHTFTETGIYQITLVVTDNEGAQAKTTKTIIVKKELNKIPIADFEYRPQEPTLNEIVEFRSTSRDPDGYITNEKWYINNQQVHEGTNQTRFTTRFTEPGTYQITILVTDNEDAQARTTKTITIEKTTNLVAIITGPESPYTNQEATYDATQSYDTSGTQIILYEWKITKNGQIIHTETNNHPKLHYAFETKGQHEITLTIYNEQGESATTTKQIYASRPYGEQLPERGFGQTLTIDYHSVNGKTYGEITENEEFTVSITVTNNGNTYLRNLRTTYSLPEYGLQEKSPQFNLEPGKTRTIQFHTIITTADQIPRGEHELLLGVSGQGITRYKYFPATLTK